MKNAVHFADANIYASIYLIGLFVNAETVKPIRPKIFAATISINMIQTKEILALREKI